MEHRSKNEDTMPSLFTLPTGEVFELSVAEFAAAFPPTPVSDNKVPTTTLTTEVASSILAIRQQVGLDGSADSEVASPAVSFPEPSAAPFRGPSCASATPLIEIVSQEELIFKQATPPSGSRSPERVAPRRLGARSASRARVDTLKATMVYNEYGELLNADSARRQPSPFELNVTELLRLVKKAYRHEFRAKLGKIIILQMDAKESALAMNDGTMLFKERLSFWGLRKVSTPATPMEGNGPPVYKGLARVLEIGCGDGNWCFKVKVEQHIGLLKVLMTQIIGYFMEPTKNVNPNDYFSQVHSTQQNPEFTVRNINSLLVHERPIPHNLYGIIRGRDLFDRVESYKTFLEDVRSILQPDGVVEFVEIDPRPRATYVGREHEEKRDHRSGPQTGWTDKIADRFKDPCDQELATTVPGWTARVEARLKATLRPRDGVAAANLKSWLEGAGFWDVTENVIQLPVGGETPSGQLLKDFQLYKIGLENEIPKLLKAFPEVELDALEHGKFYLNLHIVTGRKPKDPRPGDLLMNGTRQEMTSLVYNAMARFITVKNSQWERFDFDDKLPKVMGSLKELQGAPDLVTYPINRGSAEDGLYPSQLGGAIRALMR